MPLFLKPVLKDKVWGGTKFEAFDYELPSQTVGEAWTISAHHRGACEIVEGEYRGYTLDYLWSHHRELFGDFPSEEFPLLTKLIDAKEPLSIHVHPNDAYAFEHEEGKYGKSECWYVIEAEPGAEIIYGFKDERCPNNIDKLRNQDYENLFNKIKVQAGDFYYIPAGMIHSVGAGVLLYETMQASDISYRIYDYGREYGNSRRELNREKAIEVLELPEIENNSSTDVEYRENHKRTQLVSNDFFTMVKWDISGTLNYMKPREFVLVSVIKGEGQVVTDGEIYHIQKGSNFILTSHDLDTVFEGNFELIVSFL
ncbi:class I mannose-6-phosphate isomerase [Staphylococcus sp. SQ8-PEA]|uniref:Mannose-6-phosphate isomerase n=1 Tax=Staphylococcus marylandisciuri TaxID=2981529 RepID=A0ABT2QRJ9_9STAP|nr:type I phosphomannose isomerase catalytic subunit [Staphylococcus marylandisciuri]MCU5746608.1 class I mannose-6-phosphate isomerase [Staphylococcus marylandisciuri]